MLQINHIKYEIIDKKQYSEYQQLINDYMNELNSFISNNSGHKIQDNPATRHYLKSIHHKYHELQKQFFYNELGVEFNNLYINGEDIL